MLGADWEPAGFDLWRNEVGAWELVPEADPGWNYAAGLRHRLDDEDRERCVGDQEQREQEAQREADEHGRGEDAEGDAEKGEGEAQGRAQAEEGAPARRLPRAGNPSRLGYS